MATLSTRRGNKRVIQFTDPDGRRRTLYLGKIPKKAAATIQSHVEQLIHARLTGTTPPPATSQWLGDVGEGLHGKLVKLGLATERDEPEEKALGEFLDSYIASRTDLKPGTIRHLTDAKRKMVAFFGEFGESKPLEEIPPADGDEFRRWLLEQVGPNTARRWMGRTKQFLRHAARKRLIPANPFQDQGDTSVRANRQRDHFVTREDAEAILDACPDQQWRIIFALSRFGGLRCPSEHLALRWEDVL